MTAKEKKNLDILLSFMIKKSRVDQRRDRRQYDMQEYLNSRKSRRDAPRGSSLAPVSKKTEKEENDKVFKELIK